jgi:WD40 repeat protein
VAVFFSADGWDLYALSVGGSVIKFPLAGGNVVTTIEADGTSWRALGRSRAADLVALGATSGRVAIVNLSTGSTRVPKDIPQRGLAAPPAFSDDGRLVAVGLRGAPAADRRLHIWDLDSDTTRTLGPWGASIDPDLVMSVAFVGRGRLVAGLSTIGTVEIDLASGRHRVLTPQPLAHVAVAPDRNLVVGAPDFLNNLAEQGRSPLFTIDLKTGSTQEVSSHGRKVSAVAVDSSGSLVATGSFDGTIRIGPSTGDDPHVLMGQEGEGAIFSLAFSPDGRWLAVGGEGFATHIWPVPDITKPSLHRRPHDELLSVLRTHTNMTAVADPTSTDGYRLEPGRFEGWAQLPER